MLRSYISLRSNINELSNQYNYFLKVSFFYMSRITSPRMDSSGDNSTPNSTRVKLVKEGKAEVFYPESVFYNPVQEFNRDLTIAVINQYSTQYVQQLRLSKKKLSLKVRLQKTCPETSPYLDTEKIIDETMGNIKKSSNDETKIIVSEKDSEKGIEPNEYGIKSDDINSTSVREPGVKYDDGLVILEALSASGLRSMRFAKEVRGVKKIITNDYSEDAFEMIKKNAEYNNVGHLISPSMADGAMLMYQNKRFDDRFDVIDLDPYGSAAPFLDSAVQAVADGGLLCITCTDTAVLCGNSGETCYSKYGAMSIKTKYCHEMALRILLQSIEAHANRYSRYIVPMISMSADFYIRIFVKVFTGQGKVKQTVSKLAMIYHCTGCGTFHLQRLGTCTPTNVEKTNFKYGAATGPPVGLKCEHCGGTHHLAGPIWADKIHDVNFINNVIKDVESNPTYKTSQRILGMLSVMQEELPDQPLYYIIDHLVNVLHCIAPPTVQLRSAILNAGYEVSFSHAAKNSIKTNAPANVIWDIMRAWVKDHPISEKRLNQESSAKRILAIETSGKVSFQVRPDANPTSREKGLVRYQPNPESNWGPKPRAKKGLDEDDSVEKSQRLQGKKRKETEDVVDFKQFECKRFKKGKCDKGTECKYSHDVAE